MAFSQSPERAPLGNWSVKFRPVCDASAARAAHRCFAKYTSGDPDPHFPALLPAKNGADLYKQRCASCHDAPAGRVPSIATIQGMGVKTIYSALTAGVMKPPAAKPVTPTCQDNDAAQFAAGALRGDSPRWDRWSPGATNARFQNASAAGLRRPWFPSSN